MTVLVRAGLATEAEVDPIAAGLQGVAGDETTWIGFPPVMQVWSTRRSIGTVGLSHSFRAGRFPPCRNGA